jgi:hypothetical protein
MLPNCSSELTSFLRFIVKKGRNVISGAAELPDEENMRQALMYLIDVGAVELSDNGSRDGLMWVPHPKLRDMCKLLEAENPLRSNVVRLFGDRSADELLKALKTAPCDGVDQPTELEKFDRTKIGETQEAAFDPALFGFRVEGDPLQVVTECWVELVRARNPSVIEQEAIRAALVMLEVIGDAIKEIDANGEILWKVSPKLLQEYADMDDDDED